MDEISNSSEFDKIISAFSDEEIDLLINFKKFCREKDWQAFHSLIYKLKQKLKKLKAINIKLKEFEKKQTQLINKTNVLFEEIFELEKKCLKFQDN